MAEESIFRKKSLERLSSPEELRDYVKVTGVGLWFFLSAVIVLFVGLFVWACVGHFDTLVSTGAQVINGQVYCYISEDDASKITEETVIAIDGTVYPIEAIDTEEATPIEVTEEFDPYLAHLCGMYDGSWAYSLQGKCDLEDGVYEADVIFESVSPISLIIN